MFISTPRHTRKYHTYRRSLQAKLHFLLLYAQAFDMFLTKLFKVATFTLFIISTLQKLFVN